MSKNKSEKKTIPPGNLLLVAIYYQLILILGESVLLGGFQLGEDLIDVFCVEKTFVEYRSDENFILYDRHEIRVDILMKHVKFLCC